MPDVELTVPPLPGRDPVVLRWLAAPGAAVGAGQPLVILLTDRAEVVLPAPGEGVLAAQAVAEGEAAAGILGRLRKAAGSHQPSESRAPAAGERTAAGASLGGGPGRALLAADFRPISPTARRIAAAHGLDLGGVAGSGPGGRVVKADVLASMQKAGASPHDATPVMPDLAPALPGGTRLLDHAAASGCSPLPAAIRRPIITAAVEAEVTAALAACAAAGPAFARLGLGLSLTTYVAWLAAGLLPAHPLLQSFWSDTGVVLRRRTHLAVAEGQADRLRWALVRHAGDLALRGMARAVRDGATGDLGEATFSVVGLTSGAVGQIAAPPLPNNGAALSLGAPRLTPVASAAGAVGIRPMVTLWVSFDARAIDYGQALAFLRALGDRVGAG